MPASDWVNRCYIGDCREGMRQMIADGVRAQICITSPPYWGLRDYGVAGQLGLEKTPQEYVANLVEVFRLARELLADDGTLWIVLGDTYTSGGRNTHGNRIGYKQETNAGSMQMQHIRPELPNGLKPKDLVGIPWAVAFALRADGWWLRSEITWCKKAPMPESVRDRPTSATEKIFLLSKSANYYYDGDAVRNPPSESFLNDGRWQTGSTDNNEKEGYAKAGAQNPKNLHRMFDKPRGRFRRHAGFNDRWDVMPKAEQMAFGSNMRNWWLLGPEPYPEAHFAVFPREVPRRCILAGTAPYCCVRCGRAAPDTSVWSCKACGSHEYGQSIILDPFLGSGTTGHVAQALGRRWLGCELNPKYQTLLEDRTRQTGMVLT